MHLYEIVGSADLLNDSVAQKYIRTFVHPGEDGSGYTIWNYTKRAQYDNAWNAATKACRGLITDENLEVVARPFPKFFNLQQLDSLPEGEFTVQEKIDGSLGIGYLLRSGQPAIATRGPFTSAQATWANAWLARNPKLQSWIEATLQSGATPLFEIVYPENRIVVDYGDLHGLIHLTSIDVETGLDRPLDFSCPVEHAPFFQGLDIETLTEMERSNAEGFVLKWPCGTRAKVKHDEYVRLHRLITNVSARTIWELLKAHQSVDPLLERVPDEFYQWVKTIIKDLNLQFTAVESDSLQILSNVPHAESRREKAEFILSNAKYPEIVFAMLDKKTYADKIWDIIKPPFSTPFLGDPKA